MNELEIKSKLYHRFECEVDRLGQDEVGRIIGVDQPNISRAINHPDMVSISWFIDALKKLGFEITITIR